MILADTSVWIDHFRSPEPALVRLVQAGELLMHPYVMGELAMGSIADRKLRLRLWAMMPTVPIVPLEAVLELVEGRHLYSSGIGYMDASLLASSLATRDALLRTRDGKLLGLARKFGISADLDG
jgi:predicted nucleic acid-binding protein